MNRGLGGLALLATLSSAPRAQAERDLNESQPSLWSALHSGILAASVITSGAVEYWGAPSRDPRFRGALGLERGAEANFSIFTSRATDLTLGASMIAPVGAFGTNDNAVRFDNQLLIYGESLSLSLVLNTVVKHLVLRSRPYTFNAGKMATAFKDARGKDGVVSFYSGHSAMSFTAATAGGYLFSSSPASEGSQAALWAVELSLASFTAHGRIRAGMHYTSDVVVGALVGMAFGLGVPLLHGVTPEITPPEWVAIAGGLAFGTSAAFLFPTKMAEDLAAYDFRVNPVVGGATVSVGSTW